MPSLVLLAEELLTQARQFEEILEQNRIGCPSFDHDTLENLPDDAQELRKDICDTSHTIQQLARGARLSGLVIAFNWTDQLVLRIIWQYKLASAIPLDGDATYDHIAAVSGLSRSLVVRTIRAAVPLNVFNAPAADKVCHTAISRLLAVDEGYYSAIGLQVEDIGPTSIRLIQAWEQFGGDAGEPDQSAFSLSNRGRSLFTVLSEEPERATRFNLSMKYHVEDKAFDSFHIVKAFDWESLDHPGSRVIDLGGGHGHISHTMAEHTKNLQFVVQDLPHVIEEGRKNQPPELRARVSFEGWNFLNTQQAESPPSAFLISRCLHNWSDHHCVTILRALVPALRQSSKVLIWDVLLEASPVKKLSVRFNLQQDFIMAAISNGKDRTLAEFEELLRMSDPRFRVDGIRQPMGCKLSMIEITWAG
ncbi:MAG: hypothetical protein Q9162_005972 [Coniocarpon cinnabarinum]